MESSRVSPRPRTVARLRWRTWLRIAAALLVFGVALGLRLRAVGLLGTDYDEDDYLRAGQLYAQHLASGDWAGVINERENYEHPPLTKLAYGAILLSGGPAQYARPVMALKGDQNGSPLIAQKAHSLRMFSAIIGALTATVVALVNPLAGLLVAVNSWHIKYTSQAMLEALPCLFAALTLLLLRRSRRSGDWAFWLAAVTLGITAAGKYLYAVAGVAAVIWLIWREYQGRLDASGESAPPLATWLRRALAQTLAWSALALLVFYIFDPALWPNPVGRLRESLAFSTAYASGQHVQETGFGWEQPLYWLLGAVPWHPGVFVLLLDGVFSVIGLIALRRTWRRDRLLALWFGIMMLFLFFWPTKWPQYILTVTVPISLLAAGRIGDWGDQIRGWWRTRRRARPRTGMLLWLLPIILLFLGLVVYPLVLQTAMAATTFQIGNIRGGAPALLSATGRGLAGLPNVGKNALPYYGTGAALCPFDSGGCGNPNPAFLLVVLRNNVVWVGVTIGLATLLGLLLARLLNRRGVRWRRAWLTLFILPWAIPEFVGAMVWSTMFDDLFGPVNYVLGTQTKWLSDPTPVLNISAWVAPSVRRLADWHLAPVGGLLDFVAAGLTTTKAFWVMSLVGVWVAFPFMLLIAATALRAVPAEVYDAAQMDGASGWTLWRTITWPLIRPSIWSGMLLRGILLFNAFYIPLLLISGRNTGTETVAFLSYASLRFDNGYSVSARLNTFALLAVMVLVWWFNRRTQIIEAEE